MDFAETIRGIFGGQSSQPPPSGDDYAAPLRPMVDPAARTRAVGGSPEFQGKVDETLRDALRETAEPFKQVGRAISGRSDNPVPEGLTGGLGMATAIPGGLARGALKAGAKLGGEALEDIIAPAAKKAATGGVEDMIKAYHGSPHDFERFDLSKIGTGEGAQAYGHGLYFAENEGVAKGYRDALGPGWKLGDKTVPDADALRGIVAQKTGVAGDHVALQDAVDDLRNGKPLRGRADYSPGEQAAYDKAANVLREAKPAGKMYEVGIRANPEHFLDWDKPLSEQHHVMQRLPAEFQDQMRGAEAPTGEAMMRRVARPSFPIRDNSQSPWKASNAKTYEEALEMVGGDKSRVNRMLTPDPQYATQALREAGIPGIKYLDQGSRDPVKMKELANDLAQYREAAKHWEATGNTEKLNIANKQIDVLSKRLQETRNYVVFDDKLIDILKKYGIAGIGALPAMNAFHYQDKQ